MNSKTLILAALASTLLAGPVLAQDKSATDAAPPAAAATDSAATPDKTADKAPEADKAAEAGKRAPIDLEKFSRTQELKEADKNGDGILSDEELRDLALKRLVDRQVRQLKHRLDVNKDGTISLEAIEKHRKEQFEKLDTNKDGKLDRKEWREGRKHHEGGKHHDGKKHHKHHDGKKHHGDPKPDDASDE